MSDSYPEYLNPFAEDLKSKTKVTLKNSFKELKRSLRQSLRIKKKDEEDVTYRQKTVTVTVRRLPVSYYSQPTEALPRSRFRERVTRHEYSTDIHGLNPFDEEHRTVSLRRKGKKRAPLPPKSISSQHINDEGLEVPACGSQWSLTSVESDYSGSADNTSQGKHQNEVKRESMVDTFIDFNKNMQQFKDDTNNNNIVIKEDVVKETQSNNNIPDLVVSCASEPDSVKHQTNEDNKPSSESVVEINKLKENIAELIVKDITSNVITENNININIQKAQISEHNSEIEPYLYHEKTSLYVSGSRSELNEPETYTGTVSLYVTGSCDGLDAKNENYCNKNVIDENINDGSAPVPKQRKNKLTKNVLLGV